MNNNIFIGIIFVGIAILFVLYNVFRKKSENYSTQAVLIKSWLIAIILFVYGMYLIFRDV
ncbi:MULTISPECIES: hypothetical protein [Flavobacteriaceae]|uniref:Uncharacterized protein n=2 Tax=Flavobacteriaceae TaxID=49546 RepID=A0A4Y8ART6_9FLAO|nr:MULTISPECIES: hypothetical protein [Flavobacteriaceae]TEW73874.1 hypothetical protein E2488_10370 [Gramella jeungdoensis]GGK38291.1 hypothetical protein GCM10007963_03050 [Lutibacter litoralis]